MHRKLKVSEVPHARTVLLRKQQNTCPLCGGKMGPKDKQPTLDHCHRRGFVRDVLCRHCNGMEGKVWNIARRAMKDHEVEWLLNLAEYWKRHSVPQHGGVLHPSHKTEAEKRLARNKKAQAGRKNARSSSK